MAPKSLMAQPPLLVPRRGGDGCTAVAAARSESCATGTCSRRIAAGALARPQRQQQHGAAEGVPAHESLKAWRMTS
jgi:hypothetical protein